MPQVRPYRRQIQEQAAGIPDLKDMIDGELLLRLKAHQGDEKAQFAVARIDQVREASRMGLDDPDEVPPPNFDLWLEVHVAVPSRNGRG